MQQTINRVFSDTQKGNESYTVWQRQMEAKGYRQTAMTPLPLPKGKGGDTQMLATRRWRYTMSLA